MEKWMAGVDKPRLIRFRNNLREDKHMMPSLHFWQLSLVLDSAVKSSLLFFCGKRNKLLVRTYKGKVFLSTAELTQFEAVCLEGRLVQRSGKSRRKFRSWCLLASKRLLVLTQIWWSVSVQYRVGKMFAPYTSMLNTEVMKIERCDFTTCLKKVLWLI